MTNRAIINLSTQKYWPGQNRLIQSLQGKNAGADLFMFKSEQEIGAPLHKDNSHGFKVTAFEHVRAKGYTSILWLDASMFVIKDLAPMFEHIEREGYFWQDSGWLNETWCNDAAKAYFGNANGVMMSTGVVGLDFRNISACAFFHAWGDAMRAGVFNGSQSNHRHDQVAAGIIAHQLLLRLTPNNELWQYGNITEPPMHDKILIKAHGIV